MLAVHLEGGSVETRRVPRPKRPKGFSLVRMLVAGICNTNLELRRGYYGFAGRPGHEFVGVVVESDTQDLVGKRVVGEINLACGRCDWCLGGRSGRHCPARTVLGIAGHPGAFAEFLTLPDSNLHVVPPEISTAHAVFTEPLAAACRILDQMDISRDSRVAVLGDGKLGLLVAQALAAKKKRVHLFGRHGDKMKIAEACGVSVRFANDGLPQAKYDFVVDATGSADGLTQATSMARPCGVVVMKSTVHGRVAMDTAPVIVNELVLVGSRCGRFEPAIKLLRKGRINLDPMLSGEFKLSEAAKAFERAAERGVLKVLLRGSAG